MNMNSTNPLCVTQPDFNQEVESFNIETSMSSDVGCVRDVNEDRIHYVKPKDSELLNTKGRLAIVADGMGGHHAGAVASQLAVETIEARYYQDNRSPHVALEHAFLSANRGIRALADNNRQYSGMGTTATALAIHKGFVFTAHVGDSRLYLIRDHRIIQLTQDHSVVMDMVQSGVLTIDEARQHPDSHIITRALGTQTEVQVSCCQAGLAVKSGDRFVLTSDGLHDLVDENEILQTVLSFDVHQAGDCLIEQARNQGGYDNISIGIIAIDSVRS